MAAEAAVGVPVFTYHDATMYLAHDVFAAEKERVIFMHPAAAFMLGFLEEDEDIREAFDVDAHRRAELVLCPVNDNPDADGAGGSHWSVLVFRRSAGALEHYDSYGFNLAVAKRMVPAFRKLVGARPKCSLAQPAAPQQTNAYDCGAYALAVMRHVAEVHVRAPSAHTSESPTSITPADVSALRAHMRALAASLKAEAEAQGEVSKS